MAAGNCHHLLAAAQTTTAIKITANTRQPGLRFTRLIQTCQNQFKHALCDITVTLCDSQYGAL
ncbi:hypothetical protein D3C75_777810 [compost metagenome]